MIHPFKVVPSLEKVVGRGLHVEEARERRSAREQDGCQARQAHSLAGMRSYRESFIFMLIIMSCLRRILRRALTFPKGLWTVI